jgi:hypothetical protein
MKLERTVWTDERLDDRFNSIDQRLGRIEAELGDLRTLMFQLWGTNMLAIVISFAAVVITHS